MGIVLPSIVMPPAVGVCRYHYAMQTSHPLPTPRVTGFTLLELVVVMAIIAVLAMMTIPMFYARIPRGQVEESLPLADPVKNAVKAYYDTHSRVLPANNDIAGLPEAKKFIGSYVTAVTVTDGAVNMSFGNNSNAKIGGKRLTLRPIVVRDNPLVELRWICAGKKVPEGMDVGGVNVTDIPIDSLPANCR